MFCDSETIDYGLLCYDTVILQAVSIVSQEPATCIFRL
jgi:hypothetical protein